MSNIQVPKGSSVYLPFTIISSDGSTVDTTTQVAPSAVGFQGQGIAAQLVTADGPTSRRLRVDAGANSLVGANQGDVSVTARGRTVHQLVDVLAPPDLSSVSFGAASAAFPTPAPGDPVQFP